MKTVLFSLFILITVGLKSQALNIKFVKETHDFGTIKQGKPANFTFTFTNNEKKAITIESASASCGCTTPDWTKTPIRAGKKGTIKAIYDAKNEGPFTKTITVNFVGGYRKEITIKGNVVK
jgi:aminopeptidase C